MAVPRVLLDGNTICTACCFLLFGTTLHSPVNYDLLPVLCPQTPRIAVGDRQILLQPVHVDRIGTVHRVLNCNVALLLFGSRQWMDLNSQHLFFGFSVFRIDERILYALHHPTMTWLRMRAKGLRFVAEDSHVLTVPPEHRSMQTRIACNGRMLVMLTLSSIRIYSCDDPAESVTLQSEHVYVRVDCPLRSRTMLWLWRVDGTVDVWEWEHPKLTHLGSVSMGAIPESITYLAVSETHVGVITCSTAHQLHYHSVKLYPQLQVKSMFIRYRPRKLPRRIAAERASVATVCTLHLFYEPTDPITDLFFDVTDRWHDGE